MNVNSETSSDRDRLLGILWGLLVGDALGSPIQFTPKDGHRHITEMVPCSMFNAPAGYWTDDGSMALCIAESAVRNAGRLEPADIARLFSDWLRRGHWSSLPHAFDVGGATASAIGAWERTGSLRNGDEDTQGNGSIMRFGPSYVAALLLPPAERAAALHAVSDLTHCSARVRGVVDRMALALDQLRATGATTLESAYPDRASVNNSGWAVSTLEAALWALNTADSFEDALVAAVNLGGDADSIGAVCGQLAGAKYGLRAIPERWLAPIPRRAEIDALFHALVDLVPSP